MSYRAIVSQEAYRHGAPRNLLMHASTAPPSLPHRLTSHFLTRYYRLTVRSSTKTWKNKKEQEIFRESDLDCYLREIDSKLYLLYI